MRRWACAYNKIEGITCFIYLYFHFIYLLTYLVFVKLHKIGVAKKQRAGKTFLHLSGVTVIFDDNDFITRVVAKMLVEHKHKQLETTINSQPWES